MLASMPAKMLISLSNSMGASQAMQAGQQAMLADVQSLVDGKLKALAGQHFRPDARIRIADHRSAGRRGAHGRLVDTEGWAQAAPEMVRAAPVLPLNSIAPTQIATPQSAHQPVHASPHGGNERTRHGHAGRQDGVGES